jgi:hypothetical protein
LASDQRNRAGFERADAQLGTLQVGKDRDRPSDLFFDRANRFNARGVILVGAVAEIQPKDINAGLNQRGDLVACRAGRTQRRDNFGLTAAAAGDRVLHGAGSYGAERAANTPPSDNE